MWGGPNLADMDRGGPNPLADLDRGVQIRGGSKSAVTPAWIVKCKFQNFRPSWRYVFNIMLINA